MKKTLLVLYALGCIQAMAQDTIYFDYDWKECDKQVAAYYRLMNRKDLIYEVNDYYMSSGKPQMTGFYKDINTEIRHGKFTWYYESGNLKLINNYTDGKRLNDTIIEFRDTSVSMVEEKSIYCNDTLVELFRYYPSGSFALHLIYEKEGMRSCITYYETGEVKRKEYYSKKGKLKKGMCYTKNGEDTTYFPRYIYPKVDGINPLTKVKFISKYIKYPEYAKINGVEGKAVVSYVIEPDGSISNITIVYATHEFFGDALKKAIQATAGHWVAGEQEGKKAAVKLTSPVRFTIN